VVELRRGDVRLHGQMLCRRAESGGGAGAV
jgi:hypothetical protein